MKEELTAGYELPRAQDRQPLDRAEALTLQSNYCKELRKVRKPSLYGPGIEFYEEERIIENSYAAGENQFAEAHI